MPARTPYPAPASEALEGRVMVTSTKKRTQELKTRERHEKKKTPPVLYMHKIQEVGKRVQKERQKVGSRVQRLTGLQSSVFGLLTSVELSASTGWA